MKGVLPPAMTGRDALLTALAGLLGAAAFPPVGLWPLCLPALAILLWVLGDHEAEISMSLGLLFGAVYGLGTIWWFWFLFGPMLIGLLAIFALYFGLLGLLIGMTRGRSVFVRAILVGLFAAGVEWLRGDAWYLRFPWYTVPHALAQSAAWIAPVRWLGAYGFTIAVWFIAALGAFGRSWAWLTFALIPASSLLLADFDAPDRRAMLFQTEKLGGVEELIPSVAPAEPIHLVVMPEYTYQIPYQRPLTHPNGPAALARKLGCPVVFGAIDGDPRGDFQNVAVVLGADGNVLGLFPKQRPVPLLSDGRAGTTCPVFPVDQGTLGVAICYDFDAGEVAGTIVRSGATVLLAPTYDSMHWGAVQHENHALLFRLRAVENDRWIIRASSSGRSEVIDPHGRASAQGIEIGEMGTVVLGYGHRQTQPLGSLGYLLGPTAALLMLLYASGWVWNRRRKAMAEEVLGNTEGISTTLRS